MGGHRLADSGEKKEAAPARDPAFGLFGRVFSRVPPAPATRRPGAAGFYPANPCHMAMARPSARVSPVVVGAILFMA